MQESTEFIDLAAHINHRSCIISHELIVLFQTSLELLSFGAIMSEVTLLLQDIEELAGLGGHLLMFLDQFLDLLFDRQEHLQGFFC